MLELKDVVLKLSGNRTSKPITQVVRTGNVVCLCGAPGSGKTTLLRAIMGLESVTRGFITIDGELVDTGSASYFRQVIAYVPQDLPEFKEEVSDLLKRIFSLNSNRKKCIDEKAIVKEWSILGLSPDLLTKKWTGLGDDMRRLILLSVAGLEQRPIILVDQPVQSEAVAHYLHDLVRRSPGSEVIYACQDNVLQSDITIRL